MTRCTNSSSSYTSKSLVYFWLIPWHYCCILIMLKISLGNTPPSTAFWDFFSVLIAYVVRSGFPKTEMLPRASKDLTFCELFLWFISFSYTYIYFIYMASLIRPNVPTPNTCPKWKSAYTSLRTTISLQFLI